MFWVLLSFCLLQHTLSSTHTWFFRFLNQRSTDEHTENNALCAFTLMMMMIYSLFLFYVSWFFVFASFRFSLYSWCWFLLALLVGTPNFSLNCCCFLRSLFLLPLRKRRSNLAFEKVECLKFSHKSTYSTRFTPSMINPEWAPNFSSNFLRY